MIFTVPCKFYTKYNFYVKPDFDIMCVCLATLYSSLFIHHFYK